MQPATPEKITTKYPYMQPATPEKITTKYPYMRRSSGSEPESAVWTPCDAGPAEDLIRPAPVG